ncbi:MAG: DUF3017 domain-containing protein [Corynebacterium sp.]|nr:DUF3017 domain-containing protein [Corynebacterium sp.]
MSANPHDRDARPSSLPPKLQRVGFFVFLVGLVVACGFLATDHWRRSTFTLGCCLLWLAGLRLTCDGEQLGVLAVRSQKFDALFCTAVGGMMVFLAGTVDSLGS